MSTKQTASVSKKQLRKDLETRIDNAIGHLARSADKKFKKLVKKASKLLADGLHHKPKPAAKKNAALPAKPVVKKAASKKPATKKAAVKKAAKKK